MKQEHAVLTVVLSALEVVSSLRPVVPVMYMRWQAMCPLLVVVSFRLVVLLLSEVAVAVVPVVVVVLPVPADWAVVLSF